MQPHRNPSGLCQCGCGERTNLAPYTSSRFGWVEGEPLRFINRHAARRPITYTVQPDSGCWVFDGHVRPDGYGLFHRGKRILAHRYYYEQLVGPIPEGLTLDHLCRNRACVNPDHLEPVSNVENVMRGVGFGATNGKKTHCQRGHEYAGENLYVVPKSGYRVCRACARISDSKRQPRGRVA